MDDPYTVLGVARDATPEQIKSAYRKLARKLHPDVNPGNAQAEEKFKKVSGAYDLLGDAAKKARFDAGEIDASGAERARHRQYGAGPGGGFGGSSPFSEGFRFGSNAEDIFAELMRRRSRGQRTKGGFEFNENAPTRGDDVQFLLRVSLPEAAIGAPRRVTLPNGKSLDVKIPPSTKDGAVLRLKGQGNSGHSGGPAGDALVEIKVEAHPFFTRDGDDVLLTLPITLPEAVLGAKVTVPTIDGKVSVTIPPGSNSGGTLRLKGKGIPTASGRGDQLVSLKVVLPEKPDEELSQFLKSWTTKHPYEVRGKMETG